MNASRDDRVAGWVRAWVRSVLRHRVATLAAALASALVATPWIAANLGLNSDEDALFSPESVYSRARDQFREAFPSLRDPILVVVDGATVDLAEEASARLAARLRREPERFPGVQEPEGGRFFERHGLLYLEEGELEAVLDRLVEAQPYVGALRRDGSVRGLAGVLRDAAEATASGELEHFELASVFAALEDVVRGELEGDPRPASWAELFLGQEFAAPERRRRLLLVEPIVDFGALEPARVTLAGLREVIEELGLDDGPRARARLTGLFALSQEEAHLVADQAVIAGLGSLVLVSGVLLGGLRSPRVALAIVATLAVGLAWTAAFATAAVGHLNLISVAFAVLFIGLSVDFGIHLSLAYQERRARGLPPETAIVEAAAEVGGSLVVCAITTAIGFYAFLATDFLGVAELGLIAGTGMIVSLVANLTVLPALLATFVRGEPPRLPSGARWQSLLLRRPRAVVAGAGLVAAAALPQVCRVHFDASPLRVRDPSAESVQAYTDLLEDGRALPWNVHALAPDLEAGEALARRFEALPTVDRTITLPDYVPERQAEKLELLEDAAFLLLPTLKRRDRAAPPDAEESREALVVLAEALGPLETMPPRELGEAARGLREALLQWLSGPGAPGRVGKLEALEASLLAGLPARLDAMERALGAGPVRLETLPDAVRALHVAPDGRARVEVVPAEDLGDNAALARYVRSVRSVDPDGYGEGFAIYEIGRIVVSAFREALATAALGIAVVLLLLWRNLRDALLVAIPIGLAALLTAATMALIEMPLNFANVIVIPLLLGMGVDTGVHLVHRVRSGPLPGGDLLRTSTARAVVLSAITTLVSFGTLGFSSHRGMASLGQLLAIGIALILVCNLVLLPALVLAVEGRRKRRGAEPRADGSA